MPDIAKKEASVWRL